MERIMELKEWQKRAYEISKSKGWYDPELVPATSLERHMLMVSEIAEATEEVRNGSLPIYTKDGKPEGEAIELADTVIRIMDYFESKGWDLESAIKIKCEYNETRPYRHGGKTK
jgi:NTP pyrophosphatase (non-canonical NTP hydrolase)